MRKQWRCFHCDFLTSNRGEAEVHFGADSGSEPLCVLKASDNHLGVYIRDLEKQLDQYRAEDSQVLRAMASLESDHQRMLICEEEKGYERGLRDGMALTPPTP